MKGSHISTGSLNSGEEQKMRAWKMSEKWSGKKLRTAEEPNSDGTCLGVNGIHNERANGVPNLLRIFDCYREHRL